MADFITCWRLGFSADQGLGFSKVTGADWVRPFETCKPLLIYDDNDQPQLLCLDRTDRQYYNLTTRDGPPEYDGYVRTFKDKVGVDGTGGTDIVPVVAFPEVRGTFEHYFIELKRLHAYFRAMDEEKADEDGYDANGYPDGLAFKMEVFCDGVSVDADAEADEIALPKHQITFPKMVPECNRLFARITANMSEHILAGLQMYLITRDRPDGPDNLLMTENNYMGEMAEPSLWAGLYGSSVVDFATGAEIRAGATAAADPVSGSDAIQITTAETLGSVALDGGSLFLWVYGTVAAAIGGSAVSLVEQGAIGNWHLKYATGITGTGALVLTPTGTARYYDARAFAGAITTGFLAWYFKDCEKNGGKVVLKR